MKSRSKPRAVNVGVRIPVMTVAHDGADTATCDMMYRRGDHPGHQEHLRGWNLSPASPKAP